MLSCLGEHTVGMTSTPTNTHARHSSKYQNTARPNKFNSPLQTLMFSGELSLSMHKSLNMGFVHSSGSVRPLHTFSVTELDDDVAVDVVEVLVHVPHSAGHILRAQAPTPSAKHDSAVNAPHLGGSDSPLQS